MSTAKLMKLSTYRERRYVEGAAPDIRTMQMWCKNGKIKGAVKEGKCWYIKMSDTLEARALSIAKELR